MKIEEAYKLLKLNYDASKEDVAEAYRKASKQSHPDVATGRPKSSVATMGRMILSSC